MRNPFAGLPLLLAVLLLAAGSAQAQDAESGPGASVLHVVFVWLKDPGNAAHRAEIIRASRSFADIAGVLEVRVGESVASDRPIVDDSFDVGIYLRFATVDDMRGYLADEGHQAALRDVLRPLAERYLVYDIADPGVVREQSR